MLSADWNPPIPMVWKQLNTPGAQLSEICCHIGTPDTVWRNLQPPLYVARLRIDRTMGKVHALEPDAIACKLASCSPVAVMVSFPPFHELLRLFARNYTGLRLILALFFLSFRL